jgi:hypothetical protein
MGFLKIFPGLSAIWRDHEKLARKLLFFTEDRQTTTEEV